MAQHSEASVEEILESIKKVIARDNRDTAVDARRQRQADADEAADRAKAAQQPEEEAEVEEILDLADMELAAEAESEGYDSLIREEARNAMKENLSALATLAAPGAKPQIVRSGETSLEG